MRPRALLYNFFSILFSLIFFLVLITPRLGEASSVEEFTPEELSTVLFQNSVFHYHSKNYILSASQFSTLLEDFPEFKKSEVMGYYLSSLSFLAQDKTVGEYLRKYKSILTPEILSTLANNYQRRGKHREALEALESLAPADLVGEHSGKYHFLTARSHIALNEQEEALLSLKKISKSSPFFLEGRLIQSQLYFKMHKLERAIKGLNEILQSKSESVKGSKRWRNTQKTALLLGQIYFEKGDYRNSLSYFNRVGEGEHFPSAIEGVSWARIKLGEYKKAVKKLEVLKSSFPLYYYNRDLPMRLLLTNYYSGNWSKTKQSLEELEEFMKSKESLAKRVIESSELSEKYVYYLLQYFTGIQLIERYTLTREDRDLFQLLDPPPELISLSESFYLLKQMRKENTRGLNLFNDYTEVFKKRRELFKSFIDLFRHLKPAYLSLKKTIMEIEIPFDQIPEKNVKYVSTSLDMALKEYTVKFKRPLTKLESQLVKILVYEEYISYKGLDRNLPLFTLALKMMKTLQGLYGESGEGWKDEFNYAVDEHNKSVRMINKLNSFPRVNKELKTFKSDTVSIVTTYLKKEAYRMRVNNRLYADTANAIRADLLLQTGKRNDGQN